MERAKLRFIQELCALWTGARLPEMLEKGGFILPESEAIEGRGEMGSWQTHAAPLAAATRWIIVGVPGNKQVSWAAPGADEGHERTENICHGCHPKVNWGPPLPCNLQLTDKTFVSVSPLFTNRCPTPFLNKNKPESSVLHDFLLLAYVLQRGCLCPWEAPSWRLLWSQPHLTFEVFFSTQTSIPRF